MYYNTYSGLLPFCQVNNKGNRNLPQSGSHCKKGYMYKRTGPFLRQKREKHVLFSYVIMAYFSLFIYIAIPAVEV